MAVHQALFRVRHRDGGWTVVDHHEDRAAPLFQTQGDAVVRAKELAIKAGSAQIVVHADDGRVVSDFMHQREERSLLAEADDTASTSMHASRPATRPSHP